MSDSQQNMKAEEGFLQAPQDQGQVQPYVQPQQQWNHAYQTPYPQVHQGVPLQPRVVGPNHKVRLIWHLVFLLGIEPVVLGTAVFFLGITIILFPIAILVSIAWIGLAIWHIIAVILAIIGLSNQGKDNQPPYLYQQ